MGEAIRSFDPLPAPRPSQARAFAEIRERGLLSRLRYLVYKAIYQQQTPDCGVTSGELDRALSNELGAWTRSASPRLIELVRLGVIEELPERRCKASGQKVLAYQTTDRLPAAAALAARVTLSKQDKGAALAALLRLWEMPISAEDRPIIKKLGAWLRQQSGVKIDQEPDPPPAPSGAL